MRNEETYPMRGELNERQHDIQERAFEFACRMVKLAQFLYGAGGVGRTLANQLLRSGTSIGANLEEAHAGQSKPDFIAKCSIALKEARETYYWLRLLAACDLAPPERLAPLITEANELVAILSTIVKKAQSSPSRG
jgi:four helix bundle protein